VNFPWQSAPPLAEDAWRVVRRRAIFECCKWDPQIEDSSALSPFPLVLTREAWLEVAPLAARLARETLAAEAEILDLPELHGRLGLPRAVRQVLRRGRQASFTPGAARVQRFDFHFTDEGWRISEVNSDVPGGFIESAGFTRLMAGHYPGLTAVGDPALAYAAAVKACLPDRGLVGLVHATSYTDDRQVMAYLSRALEALGLETRLLGPDQVGWRDGLALTVEEPAAPIDLLVRFFPGEWLPNLRRRSGWTYFFSRGRTPVSNPATALLTQTKRFPLVWDALQTPMATWRRLLPATCDPRRVAWRGSSDWVLKPSLGRVGEDICLPGVTPARLRRQIERQVRWFPSGWVAQRRFNTLPLQTPSGPMYPCLGVFTIGDSVAGAYGRLAAEPLINYKAQDAAVLVANG
jgi:glutathionylspermidine synthase